MKNLFTLLFTTICISATYAQVGINDNGSAPHSSAQLDVKSTTKAFYPPRMTTAQKNAIGSPQAGAVVFDNTINQLSFYNGTAWVQGGGSSFALPYVGVYNTGLGGGYVLDISNSTGSDGTAIVGRNSTQISGEGIFGIAGATAPLSSVAGVYGLTNSTNANGVGVKAFHSGLGSAFFGSSINGIGATLNSTNGFALKTQGKLQIAGNGVGTLGVNKFLKSINASGDAEWSDLLPFTFSGNNSISLLTITNTNTGPNNAIYGITNSLNQGKGVYGVAQESNPTGDTYGIYGFNQSSNTKGAGVYGNHYGTGAGVFGESDGVGVMGKSMGTAVFGDATTAAGIGGYFSSFIGGRALITNGGNIGVNTVAPKYPITFSSVIGDKISFFDGETSNTTNHYGIGIQSAALQFFVPSTSQNLVFGTGRSGVFIEKMRITGGGNVGIGTNNPTATIYVKRGTGTDGTAAFSGTVHTTHLNYATDEDTFIRGGKNGSDVLINDIVGLGNVGIKNDNPAFALDVKGRMRLRHEGPTAEETAGLWFDGTSLSPRSFIGTLDNIHMGIYGIGVGWNITMNVNNGNTGIGTELPNSRLQVAGSVSMPYKEVSTNYTLTDNDYSVRYIPSSTCCVVGTLTLPTPSTRAGRIYVLSAELYKQTGASFNTVSIMSAGQNIIQTSHLDDYPGPPYDFFNVLCHIQFNNGSVSFPTKRKTSVTVQSTGTKWVVIDNDFQY